MALKLSGKDDRLTRQDFLALAPIIDLTLEDVEAGLSALETGISKHFMTPQLSTSAYEFDGPKTLRDKVSATLAARCVAPTTESWSD
jgi:serine/threonine-protein kinase HipA